MYLVNNIKHSINYHRQNFVSYLRKVKLRYSLDNKNINHLKRTVKLKKKWYGSSYGGFYVNPDLIHENSIVYSFGIGKDISFDKKIMKNHLCKVYGFDPTPKAIDYVENFNKNKLFIFNSYGISTTTGKKTFYMPANDKGVSASMHINSTVDKEKTIIVNMKNLADIMKELGHNHIDVLKIDIEGSEYEVIESILESNITITQLLVEFHDRFFNETEIKSVKTVELLNKKGYKIFASSLNYEEISFINKKNIC